MSSAAQSLGDADLKGVTKEEELLKREEELKRKENEWERREERKRQEERRREEEWKKREDFIYRSMHFIETMLLMSTQGVRKAKSKATPPNMSDVTASEVGTSDLDPATFPKVIDWLNRQHPGPSLSVSGYGTESVKGSHIGKDDQPGLMDHHVSGDTAKTLQEGDLCWRKDNLWRANEVRLREEELKKREEVMKRREESGFRAGTVAGSHIETGDWSREKHSDEHMRADSSPNPNSEESVKELLNWIMRFLQASEKHQKSVDSSQNAALEECLTMLKKIQPSQPQSGTVNDTQAEDKSTSGWSLFNMTYLGWFSSATTNYYNKPTVVKVHCVVSGKTLDSHLALLQRVKDRGELELQETDNLDTCDVIILFCPIVSRMGTDIEAAMKLVPGVGDKAIILVLLHHTFDGEYTVPHVSADSRVMCNISALFHDTQGGLLQCEINTKAVKLIHYALLLFSKSPA